MKFILSEYGGEYHPTRFLNALFAYPEDYSAILIANNVPICGAIECNPEMDLDILALEFGGDRKEVGLEISVRGNNFNYLKCENKVELNNLRKIILQSHSIDILEDTLFERTLINASFYALDRIYNPAFKYGRIVCIDDLEPHASVIEYINKYDQKIDPERFIKSLEDSQVGYVHNVPRQLFSTTKRYRFNSVRNENFVEAKPSIIFPLTSKYYHFWTDKLSIQKPTK